MMTMTYITLQVWSKFCSFLIAFALIISEFDQFLADRAAAGGQRTGSVKSGSNRPRQRQMQMENQADDEMFGL